MKNCIRSLNTMVKLRCLLKILRLHLLSTALLLFCTLSVFSNVVNSQDSESKANIDLQPKRVTGVITDLDGNPLAGAAITIKGTLIGIIADADGNYVLDNVPVGATLVFSFIGMETEEVIVGDRTIINIVLLAEATDIAEVVVTGYQTLSRERATGSFETVTGDVLAQRPTNNFVDKLDGIASGVAVKNGDITIRGKSTIEANDDPLYVVDGFPLAGSTLTVNPEDIESITVLKDAAAASIWGVRASNGVIVVTTKKGSKEGTKVNFSTFLEINEGVEFDKQNWVTTEEEIELYEEYFEKGWYKNLKAQVNQKYPMNQLEIAHIYFQDLAPDGTEWTEEEFNTFMDELKTKDVLDQWEEYMTQRSVRQTYNLSISGGGEQHQVYASLLYNDNQDMEIGNNNDRVVLNLRDEFTMSDRLKFTTGINASMRNYTLNGIGPGTVEYIRAYEELVDENGDPIQYYRNYHQWASQEREALEGSFPYTNNHLDQRNNLDRTQQRIDVRSQFGLEIKIIEGLKFNTKFQYELGTRNREDFNTMDLPSQRIKVMNFYRPDAVDEDSVALGYQMPVGTEYNYWKDKYYAWDFRNTLSYDKSWGNSDLKLFGGAEVRKHRNDNVNSRLYGYDRQSRIYAPVDNLGFRSGEIVGWNKNILNHNAFTYIWNNDLRDVSFFGNAGYTYSEKYLLTGSFRVDQKNLFGSDPRFRYKPLWSVGLGWHLAKENFMSGINNINRLTLRTTYGITGNASEKFSPYAMARPEIVTRGGKIFEYTILDNPPNDQLKWEETATLNIGIDFAFFKSRIDGSIDLYNKNSTDLLGERPLDPTNGFATATVNYASMNNKGIDLKIRSTILQTKDFKWDVRLLFSYNRNRVTDVVDEIITADWLAYSGALTKGLPLENLYSFNYAGLSDAGDVLLHTTNSNGDTIVNWRDYYGNELKEDLLYYGTRVAPVYGGLSSTLHYKGFDLSINLTYKFGYKFKHYYNTGVDAFDYDRRAPNIWVDRWREPGDEETTRIPKIAYNGKNPYSGVKEFWWDSYTADWYWQDSQDNILDGGLIRVKEILLGYNLSPRVLKHTPLKSLRASVQITNPFLWLANDRGIDPEYRYNRAWHKDNLKSITAGIRATF